MDMGEILELKRVFTSLQTPIRLTFDHAIPHLESGGVTADVGGVDETQPKDPYAATVE